MKPTWGVSFSLPQSGVGPIPPYPGNPLGNPYPNYGLGGHGINLGPVSVNPLVAVQVTKDEYGEKVIKPYVNLHVTPNQGLIHKLGHLLAYKKHGLHGNYGGTYAPHYHSDLYPSRPYYPLHNIHQHEHYPIYHRPSYHDGYPSDYYKEGNDYEDDYIDDYYRMFHARNKLTKNQESSTKNFRQKSSNGQITFSDRKKRETIFSKMISEVRAVG